MELQEEDFRQPAANGNEKDLNRKMDEAPKSTAIGLKDLSDLNVNKEDQEHKPEVNTDGFESPAIRGI